MLLTMIYFILTGLTAQQDLKERYNLARLRENIMKKMNLNFSGFRYNPVGPARRRLDQYELQGFVSISNSIKRDRYRLKKYKKYFKKINKLF